MVTEFGFGSLKFICLAFNIQKMDRFSYEASFFYLRSQMTNALDKCRFLLPIREVFLLQNTYLDLSGDEILNAQVSSKYKHSFILLVFIARLLHKLVRCTMFLSPLKNWSYPQLFSFPLSCCLRRNPLLNITKAKRASLRFIVATFSVHFCS